MKLHKYIVSATYSKLFFWVLSPNDELNFKDNPCFDNWAKVKKYVTKNNIEFTEGKTFSNRKCYGELV